jgi:hypothetical protein
VLNEIVGFSEGLGSRFGILAIGERVPQSQDSATSMSAGIEHRYLMAGLHQFVGRGKSGEAGTRDENFFGRASCTQ